MLQYIIKSAVLLSALYIPYMLMLRKETFFRFNRMVLLSIMLLSLVLPFIDIHSWAWQSSPLQEPVQGFIEVGSPFILATGSGGSPVTHAVASNADTLTINWWWIATALYAIGMLATLLFKLAQMIILYKTIRRGVLWKYKTAEGVTIYCHTGNIAPFSWMRSIVISEEDFECNETAILSHEMGHIRHWHSLDILLANVCQIVQWANPMAWLLASSLRDIHEYEADDAVLQAGIDATQYQNLLIKKAVGSSSYAFANSFNHSLLKKRITMMLNKKSNPWMRTKALYLIPVGVVALSAFATPVLTNHVSPATVVADQASNGDKVTAIPTNEEIAEAQTVEVAQQSTTTPKAIQEDTVHYAGQAEYTETTASTDNTNTTDNANTSDNTEVGDTDNAEVDDTDNAIFLFVDDHPTYKEGQEALIRELSQSLRYPAIAKEHGVSGRVMVQFVVEKDGTCSNIAVLDKPDGIKSKATVTKDMKIEASIHVKSSSKTSTDAETQKQEKTITEEEFLASKKSLEDEAKRMVGLTSGKWNPGKHKGEVVRVRLTFPITFKLN